MDSSFSNSAIALAYFVIPLALVPLLTKVSREIRLNLLLAFAFVLSCGIGHTLAAVGWHITWWHWVTAVVSWAATGVLLKSQHHLRYLGEYFQLLEATWEQSITGKSLWELVGNDLRLLKINPAGLAISRHQLQPGDFLCQKMPFHRQVVYPYDEPLIDLYLQALSTGESRRLEFRYDDDVVSGWYLALVTPLSPNRLFITSSEISGILHDPLTGLYNRRIFQVLDQDWEACLFLDLDRFKLINDQRGHHLGDLVLKAVAGVLQDYAHQHHGIAVRDGGDEFILLLPPATAANSEEVATDLLQAVSAIDVQGIQVGVSIGIARGEIQAFENESRFNQLCQAAETALREAKQKRIGTRICIWDNLLAQRQLRQSQIEAHLQQLSTRDEFRLVYQPICEINSGRVIGAEALIRWRSPALGSISPNEFIPIAETTGLIYSVSDWVIRHALEQFTQWHRLNPELTLSINISPLELDDEDCIERIVNPVLATGIPSHLLGIEVTERGIYRNFDFCLKNLRILQAVSLRLKVDDFGTGQSGLEQLLQFQFDEVKVDRAFIPNTQGDMEKMAICQAVAKLSEGLGFDLVAEGIETLQQRNMMQAMNYHYGQGYWYARPMEVEAFTALLQQPYPLGQSTLLDEDSDLAGRPS